MNFPACYLNTQHLFLSRVFDSHFRSKYKHLDRQRGFRDYIHLPTKRSPPILKAKLDAGFPHVSISIKSTALNNFEFDICKYNVAMILQLRRYGKLRFSEALQNDRYYKNKQIPIARTAGKNNQLINFPSDHMLEILVKPPVILPVGTTVSVFSAAGFLNNINNRLYRNYFHCVATQTT